MNETELKQFIESRGYTNVTVKSYTKSCRIHYCTAIDSITLNLKAKVSDLPMYWLDNRFEPLLSAISVSIVTEKKEGETVGNPSVSDREGGVECVNSTVAAAPNSMNCVEKDGGHK